MKALSANLEDRLIGALIHFFGEIKQRKAVEEKTHEDITNLIGDSELHILLADDDEDDRQFFTDALTMIAPSLKLTTVQDGEELIKKLKKSKSELPDFIFLDLNMPYKNGLECLKEIKSMDTMKNIPVLIYSTSTNSDQIETTYQNGANLYIQKPNNFDGIIRVLKTIFSVDSSCWFQQPAREQFLLK
ncbi:MAG: response regulator [Bacteroidota bacterium]|nr:response regulator [Bacteroidota bacterium]